LLFLRSNKEQIMEYVTSKDGTSIACDKLGDGPPVILVCGGSVDRMSNAGLADVLASLFTVYNYDRRGRGDSGDTAPYAVEREIEDIAAVVEAAGGTAYLYGTSSGAALALEAARALPAMITRLALWEPPYIIEGTRALPPANTAQIYRDLVAQGKRGEAVEYFMLKVVGLPPDFAAFARTQPWWAGQEAIAHTLAYDAEVMADYGLPTERAAAVQTPTIVLAGGASFPFIITTAEKLAEVMPNAQYQLLKDQQHNVDPAVIGQALTAFFNG
jgi:pimeloyl-ACP methyl ester carboxylesterase